MTLECPYCEKEFKKVNEGERPDQIYDEECPHCGKSFAYEIEIEIRTISRKADCLNGGEHEWSTPVCSPEFMTRRVCPCGESEYIYKGQERQAMADQYYKEIKRDL